MTNVCRCCLDNRLDLVLQLPDAALAGHFVDCSKVNVAERYPMRLFICRNCGLLQCESIDLNHIYRDYHYVSSNSALTISIIPEFMIKLQALATLHRDDYILEIGCSDGLLLFEFLQRGYENVFGCEPATSLADKCLARGIPTLKDYFAAEKIIRLVGRAIQFKVIIARHVLEHIENLFGFMRDISCLSSEETTLVIEVPYLLETLGSFQYDNFYHQHLSYFSVKALRYLLGIFSFRIVHIAQSPIAGGSIQCFAKRNSQEDERVQDFLERETDLLYSDPNFFSKFSQAIIQRQSKLKDMLLYLKAEGNTIAACSAGVRASAVLSYCRLDNQIISYIFDTDEFRQTKKMAGHDIPIVPEQLINKLKPDYILILTPEYAEKIIHSNQEYLLRGGKFIKVIPQLEIVGA